MALYLFIYFYFFRIIFYPVPNSESIQSMSSSIHLLFYANSAINPLIYNFMSGKYKIY